MNSQCSDRRQPPAIDMFDRFSFLKSLYYLVRWQVLDMFNQRLSNHIMSNKWCTITNWLLALVGDTWISINRIKPGSPAWWLRSVQTGTNHLFNTCFLKDPQMISCRWESQSLSILLLGFILGSLSYSGICSTKQCNFPTQRAAIHQKPERSKYVLCSHWSSFLLEFPPHSDNEI